MKANKIVVPIDFTQTSKVGANYAIFLAEPLHSEIIFVHAYSVGNQFGGYGAITYAVPDNFVSNEKFYKEKMTEFLENFPQLSSINFRSVFAPGSTVDIICQVAKKEEAKLIIMGTEGTNAVEGYFIGTISEKISRMASCPVMIIPEDFEVSEIKSISLALDSDNLKSNIELGVLADLLNLFDAKLYILHFLEDNNKTINKEEVKDYYVGQFQRENISFHLLSNGEKDNIIDNFLQENRIDVLALIYREHGLFKQLTEMGLRKKMVFDSNVPILILK
ncbi:universal stress protein [Antarcticibacterium arcticum]|uniref:Universal stress protein n=1 Tax=Antarcticibacterium arcticum TaxID=2585771 RepID=A0A5B8YGR3_9FLAO|nr:universal stress protein [Antarcticibacterium arcticum]QED37182.1 universal stress protein [Antarcticibacterium arcticum]